jgi:Holliday junction resolvasome RuvABC endonuclease subunit
VAEHKKRANEKQTRGWEAFDSGGTDRKRPMNPILLSLDPATRITGYALHEKTEGSSWALKQYGIIKSPTPPKEVRKDPLAAMNWRCLEINSRLRNMIITTQPTQLIMEFPEYQPNRSLAEGKAINAIRLLAYLCGKIALGWELYMAEVMRASRQELPLGRLVPPRAWKGQTTKEITAHRLQKHYGISETEDNCVDAIMIGRWWVRKNGHDVKAGEAERRDL